MSRPSARGGVKGVVAPPLKSGLKAPRGWGYKRMGVRGKAASGYFGSGAFQRDNPTASSAEANFFLALEKMGLKPGSDFVYKANLNGIIADFYFPATGTAVLIHGATRQNAINIAKLQTLGLRVVSVESDALLNNPLQTAQGVLREM